MNCDLVWLFGHPLKFRRFILSAIATFGGNEDIGQREIAVEWKESNTDVAHSATLTLMWNLATLRKHFAEIDEELQILRTRDDDQATRVMEAAVLVAVAVMAHVEPGTKFTRRSDTGTRHDYYLNETNDEMIEVAGRWEGGLPGLFEEKKTQSDLNPALRKRWVSVTIIRQNPPKPDGGVALVNATANSEYRKLELDSSNDMMDHDADRTLGRYAKAALHMRDAGLMRLRMGQMMFDANDYAQAAADWLSAAACFYLATDSKRMQDALDRARKLRDEGKIPPERRDIHEALKEREEQVKELEDKLARFSSDYFDLVGPEQITSPKALDFLLGRVRELPGFAALHAAITSHAGRLGQRTLAVQHLDWATKIEPNSPQLEAFRTSLLLISPDREQGLQKARELLNAYPEMADLRMYYAMALISEPRGRDEDWGEALAVLQPLLQTDSGGLHARLGAFALAAIARHRVADDVEYHRLLVTFERLAADARSPLDQDFVQRLRREFPQIFPHPGSNGTPLPTKPNYAAVRTLFEQFSPLAVSA
jgi:tetratricopeptide (TPR) repeat protein